MAVDTTIGLFQRSRLNNYLGTADKFIYQLSRAWPTAAADLTEVGIGLPDIGAGLEVGKEYTITSHFGEFLLVLRYVVSDGDLFPAIAFSDTDWTLPGPNKRQLYSARVTSNDHIVKLVGIDGHVLSRNADDMSWMDIANLVRRVAAFKLELDSAPLL